MTPLRAALLSAIRLEGVCDCWRHADALRDLLAVLNDMVVADQARDMHRLDVLLTHLLVAVGVPDLPAGPSAAGGSAPLTEPRHSVDVEPGPATDSPSVAGPAITPGAPT